MEMRVSVVIITKDEEVMLPGCLKTVGWAEEVIVVDTGSVDKTVEIAETSGAKVVKYLSGKNFSDWRNKGLNETKGEWLFYVDADERIPDNLGREIINIAQDTSIICYAVPRRNFVLGKELKNGGFWPDYQKRLFKRSALKGWTGKIHEEPVFGGSLGHLKNPMIHEKHETFSEMIEKTNKWSEAEAKLMFDANHPPMNIPRFASAIVREFWTRMIKGRAFLDGKVGIVFAIYQVFSKFISYAKLWELQTKK